LAGIANRLLFLANEMGLAELTSNDTVMRAVKAMEVTMGFGRGLLLWLLGIPLPIIILLALFWHH
jgi:hypothetical protein